MADTLVIALLAALGSGILIGTQSNLTNLSGQSIGPIRTGLLMNLFGGTVALLVLIVMLARGDFVPRDVPRPTLLIVFAAGIIGILIITGVAYALPRTGLAVGFAAIITGQMVVGLLVDTLGLGGAAPLPLDGRRVLGLVVMAAAVYLLLPEAKT
jgi:transporter family-2 protein